ncbi:MAG: hypothetical protein KC561_08475, partial [Myxococcales bacterium]|nr:hypothetical protein [Myxococcales bacterium]
MLKHIWILIALVVSPRGELRAQVPPDVTQAAIPQAQIIYDVRSGGVSNGATRLRAGALLFERAESIDLDLQVRAVDYSAFYSEGRYLFLPPQVGLPEFLADSPHVVGPTAPVTVMADDFSINWVQALEPDSGLPASVYELLSGEDEEGSMGSVWANQVRSNLEPMEMQSARITSGSGIEASLLFTDTEEVRLPEDPYRWEPRLQFTMSLANNGQVGAFYSTERRVGDGTRRLLWEREQFEADEPSVLVLAGDSVEGRSWLPDESLNLHRGTTWSALRTIPDVIAVPSESELAAGVSRLSEEADEAGVTLFSANLMDSSGESHLFEPFVLRELGGLTVAFIGLTPPSIVGRIDPKVAQNVQILDPSASLQSIVDDLIVHRHPDLIVLVSAMSREDLTELAGWAMGIDLVIGPSWPGVQHEHTSSVQSATPPSETETVDRRPLLFADAHPAQVGTIQLSLDEQGLELAHRLQTVSQEWPVNLEWLEPVNHVRHDLYVAQAEPLFPNSASVLAAHPELADVYLRSLRGDANLVGMGDEFFLQRYSSVFSASLWLNYVANTVRRALRADVALVRTTALNSSLVGPISELFVNAFLSDNDKLLLYRLDGGALRDLLNLRGTVRQASDSERGSLGPPTVSGAAWEEELVGGRSIEPHATYSVAISSYLAAQPEYAELLEPYAPNSRFRGDDTQRFRPDSDGQRVRLHALISSDLQRRRAEDPTFGQS